MPHNQTSKPLTMDLSDHTDCEYMFSKAEIEYMEHYTNHVWNPYIEAKTPSLQKMLGSLVHRWRQKFYHTAFWDRLRRHTLEKADYVCTVCKRAMPLSAHHIMSMTDGGSPFNVDNLMALCNECHNREERQLREDRRQGRFLNDKNYQWTRQIDKEGEQCHALPARL